MNHWEMLMKFDKLKLSIQKLNKTQKQELINYIKSSYSVFEDNSAGHLRILSCIHHTWVEPK